MQLINLEDQKSRAIEFDHRDKRVAFRRYDDFLSVYFARYGEPGGEIIFEGKEVVEFKRVLSQFFIEKRGRMVLNYDAPSVIDEALPLMQISTTNWGEPFEIGLRFEFKEDFKDYSTEPLYFDVEEYSLKSLFDFLS